MDSKSHAQCVLVLAVVKNNLALTTEPFFGSRGLGPRFRFSRANQQNSTLPTLSEIVHVAQVVVSPEAVLGDARTRLLHPKGYVMWLRRFFQFQF